MLPPVRVPDDLREAAEGVLLEGETLSSFIQQSVERAVEWRRLEAAFRERADGALAHYRRTGRSQAAGEVAAGLRSKLERRRKHLAR